VRRQCGSSKLAIGSRCNAKFIFTTPRLKANIEQPHEMPMCEAINCQTRLSDVFSLREGRCVGSLIRSAA
jgi:hypothetical protein